MKISYKGFRLNKSAPQIAEEVTGGKDTILFATNEAKRLMDPYVPFADGGLSTNVDVYVEKGQGVVHYRSPYAGMQYGGKVMVSDVTGSPWARYGESKHTIDKELRHSKFRHPLATSEWDKAMKTARMSDLENAIQNHVRGGK